MDNQLLVQRFETDRSRLQAVAYRLLGSASEADDAVQEAWLRLSRSDAAEIENLSGWLTTVVSRVCLDMLRARKSRREEPLSPVLHTIPDQIDPEQEAVLADSVELAMLAVLQRLSPAERVAFVLHDVFGVSFDEVATIVGRTPVAARQLASRGRRKARGGGVERQSDIVRQREVVEAFFLAARSGDFQALLAVLDPEVELRMDPAALQMGIRSGFLTSDLRGADAVARQFSGAAQGARLALLDGLPGGAWAPGERVVVAFSFAVRDGRIAEIRLIADRETLGRMQVQLLS